MVISSQNVLATGSTHIKGELRARNLRLEEQQGSWNEGNSVRQIRILFLFVILFLAVSLFEHMLRPADGILKYGGILQWCICREGMPSLPPFWSGLHCLVF